MCSVIIKRIYILSNNHVGQTAVRAGLGLCCFSLSSPLHLLPDPVCQRWPGAQRGGVAAAPLGLTLPRIGGSAAETVGVTGAIGTDWLISHSHLRGIKEQEAWWV